MLVTLVDQMLVLVNAGALVKYSLICCKDHCE